MSNKQAKISPSSSWLAIRTQLFILGYSGHAARNILMASAGEMRKGTRPGQGGGGSTATWCFEAAGAERSHHFIFRASDLGAIAKSKHLWERLKKKGDVPFPRCLAGAPSAAIAASGLLRCDGDSLTHLDLGRSAARLSGNPLTLHHQTDIFRRLRGDV